ncbi:unnamed protein product [Lactuca saligna]|uniref:Vps16 C-terminal domain-containing protein n=1 Tax=Lactuca saligna TaxID=75948 RepID=A0AA35YVB7_LACSI|nr:unnamed protein product [Lactuca saligna]
MVNDYKVVMENLNPQRRFQVLPLLCCSKRYQLIWDRTLGLPLKRSRRSLGLPATPNAIIEEDPIMWIGLEIKALLQNVGKSFCPNYVDWFRFEAADIPPRSADKSVVSKFLQTNPSDHTTFKLKEMVRLMKEKRFHAAFKCYYNFHKINSISSDNLHYKMANEDMEYITRKAETTQAVYIRRKYGNKQLSSSIYLSEAEPFLEQYASNEEDGARSISYAAVAAHADQTSRRKLAPFQVPLLLGIGEEDTAPTKATESGDTDLVYIVLFHIWQKRLALELFGTIQARPIAHDLFTRDSRYHILAWLKSLEETRLKKK